MTLLDLPKGTAARIIGFDTVDASLETRLREIGFAEGDSIALRHTGLFGGNPVSVALNDAHIALRRNELAVIRIEAV